MASTWAYVYNPDDTTVHLVQGRAPRSSSEVVMESSTLKRSRLAVGDTTRAVIGSAPRQVTVVGEVKHDAPTDGTLLVAVDEQTARDRAARSEQARAEALGFISVFLLVFAAVSLFVGGFIIANTFSMLVARRTRELALLRAVGAARGQVLRVVLGEAAVVDGRAVRLEGR